MHADIVRLYRSVARVHLARAGTRGRLDGRSSSSPPPPWSRARFELDRSRCLPCLCIAPSLASPGPEPPVRSAHTATDPGKKNRTKNKTKENPSPERDRAQGPTAYPVDRARSSRRKQEVRTATRPVQRRGMEERRRDTRALARFCWLWS